IVSASIFFICAMGMFYYGYKTFYIETETVEATNYTYHFALIAEEADNDYWRLLEKGAKKAAEENNIFLEYLAPQKADYDHALTLLDRLIAAQVDGIITQGSEGERFVDLVHKGVERGIPMVTVDADVKSSERKASVGRDIYYAGPWLGETVVQNTAGEQYVGVITGRFDAINQQERLAGFKEAIASYPRIKIVATEESNITEIGAARAVYTLLKEHPEITALVGTSALDGVGMVEGLEDIAPNKNIFLAVFDRLPETCELIREGKIDATIAQYPERMGYEAIRVMIDLQKRDLLENVFHTETTIIHEGQLQQCQENGE